MKRWSNSGVIAFAAVVWSVAILSHLVKELSRLLETGSGLIAIGSTLSTVAVPYLGPPTLLVAVLLALGRVRKGRHAA